MTRYRKLLLGLLLACAVLPGCAPVARQPAVPMDRTTEAVPLGVPNARYFVDGDLSGFTRDAMKSIERERATLAASGKAGEPLPPINTSRSRAAAMMGPSARGCSMGGPSRAHARNS